MPPLVIVLESHVLDHETGFWCPTCLLPTGIQVRVGICDRTTLHVMNRFPLTRCADCGRDLDPSPTSTGEQP